MKEEEPAKRVFVGISDDSAAGFRRTHGHVCGGNEIPIQKISDAAEFETSKYVMAVDTGYAVGPIDDALGLRSKGTPGTMSPTGPDDGMVVDLEVADGPSKSS